MLEYEDDSSMCACMLFLQMSPVSKVHILQVPNDPEKHLSKNLQEHHWPWLRLSIFLSIFASYKTPAESNIGIWDAMDKLNGKPSCDFLAPKEFLPILLVVLETFAKGAWKFALTKNDMTVFLGSFSYSRWSYIPNQFTINDHHHFSSWFLNARYGFWNLQYHPFQFPRLLQPVPIPRRVVLGVRLFFPRAANRILTKWRSKQIDGLEKDDSLIRHLYTRIFPGVPCTEDFWGSCWIWMNLRHFTIYWSIGCNMSQPHPYLVLSAFILFLLRQSCSAVKQLTSAS